MSRIDDLVRRYEGFVALPWDRSLAGVQRIWFAVYDRHDERRLRAQVEEFELATRRAGHGWRLVDLTDAFARWMANHDYRDAYFEEPEFLDDMALKGFQASVCDTLRNALQQADEQTVVAVLGAASLFGLTRVSAVIQDLERDLRGRLLVFFPGEHERNNYRLLDARDGWNYMAVPITARDGVER